MMRKLTGLLLLFLPTFTQPAYGYLDPGAGSMLLQMLLAAIAAAVVAIKLYWQRIKAFLFRRGQKAEVSGDEASGNGGSN